MSIGERVDAADAAFVGRLASVRGTVYEFEVDQVVKGRVGERVRVRSARGVAQCGLRRSPRDEAVGVLLTRAGSGWASSLCAETTAGELLSSEAEPPGQRIKLGFGIAVLLGVLAFAFARLRRRRLVER